MKIVRLSTGEDGYTEEASYKTLHKIAVRSYEQPFGGKNLKRGLITDHFWDENLKRGLIKSLIRKKTFCSVWVFKNLSEVL